MIKDYGYTFRRSNSFVIRLSLVASSTTSFILALVITNFALEANCKVLLVSSINLEIISGIPKKVRSIDCIFFIKTEIDDCHESFSYLSDGVMQQTIAIFAFPLRLGWSRRVSLLSLNETWVPGWDKEWITRLRDSRDWLILPPRKM